MNRPATRPLADEEGATMVEYALMIALVAAALVGIISSLGAVVAAKFTSVAASLQ